MPRRLDLPDDELVRLYREGISANALSRRYDCCFRVIAKRLRAHGITLHRTSQRVRAITREVLEEQIGKGLSDPQIARRFHVSALTIRKLRLKYKLLPHPKHRKRSTKDTKDTNDPGQKNQEPRTKNQEQQNQEPRTENRGRQGTRRGGVGQ